MKRTFECSTEDCHRKVKSKNLCALHEALNWGDGDPLAPRPSPYEAKDWYYSDEDDEAFDPVADLTAEERLVYWDSRSADRGPHGD